MRVCVSCSYGWPRGLPWIERQSHFKLLLAFVDVYIYIFIYILLFYFSRVTVSAVLQPCCTCHAICFSCSLCCMSSWQINDDDDDDLA